MADDTRSPRCRARTGRPVLAFASTSAASARSPQFRGTSCSHTTSYTVEYMGRRLSRYWKAEGCDLSQTCSAPPSATTRPEDPLRRVRRRADHDWSGSAEGIRPSVPGLRQCLAAHTAGGGPRGSSASSPKENFSNGCIATVDVTYPVVAVFLLFNPELLAGQLEPVLDYAQSDRGSFPFAPHDLGTYPKANGQVYGGGEKTEKTRCRSRSAATCS